MTPNNRLISLIGIAAIILAAVALTYAQDPPAGENWLSMDQGPQSPNDQPSDLSPHTPVDSPDSNLEVVHISAKDSHPETKQIEYQANESPESSLTQAVASAPEDTPDLKDSLAPDVTESTQVDTSTPKDTASVYVYQTPGSISSPAPAKEPISTTPPEENNIDKPENPTPTNGAREQSLNPILGWSGIEDGREVTYTVYMGTSPTSMPKEYTVIKNSLILPTGLDQATTYYWKVEASDGDKTSTSDVWSFTTQERPNRPPNRPQEPRPMYGAKDVAIRPTLSWSSEDPDGDTIEYTVYLSTNSSSEPLEYKTSEKSLSVPSNLSSGITYYWKVEASDGRLDNTSDIWSFTTQSGPNCPPNKPRDPKPNNYAKDQPTNPVLSWHSEDLDGDPITYKVYMGPTLNQMTQIYEGPEDNCSAPTSNYGVTNFWRVDASDGKLTNSSDVWSFTTEAQPVWEQPNTVNALIGAIIAVVGGFAANYVRSRKK